ncbi:oncostatin-M-specific receptor subunit beta-like [Haliotis asinina]|uniref:oncostatin-M-specific receptor subunit beta-like n=1 Tax=Haliotis asinina TaxID=109174 RepID=UPI00353189C9
MYFTKRHLCDNTTLQNSNICRKHTSKYIHKPISSENVQVINSSAIQLQYKTKEAKVDEGNYRCYLSENNQSHEAMSYIKLYRRMKTVTNVSCVVDNWSTMTCTWQWEVSSSPNSDATLSWGTNGVASQICVDDTVPGSCHWPAEIFNMGSLYTIVVNSTTASDLGNILEVKVSDQFVFNTSEIVKPATLTDISATNFNSTCVLLSWQHAETHRLACQILYNCSSWQESCQPVDNVSDGSACVCGLLSGTMYQWNVSCLPEEGGFWSRVSSFIHTTQTDVPASQPEVHPGSFLQVDCEEDNCRGILLFWKAVPAHLRNGPITEYHIFVEDTNVGNETDITVTNMIQTSLELRLEPNNTYQVQTSACTEMGCSTKSKHITILPEGKGVSPPQDFTVEFMTEEKPSHFNINWQPLHTRVVSYTIYWCMREDNTTACTTPLDWVTVAPNTTEYNLTLPGLIENATQDYMVGISAEAIMTLSRTRRASDTGQVTSSGITWSQCLHISGNIPTAAPEVLHMTSDPSTASIDLEWQKLTCLETPSVLTGVLVMYCVVDGGNSCLGPEHSQMAVGRGSSYTLKDLDTGHTYLIKVCGVSAAGNGPFSTPVKVDLKAYLALMYTVLIVASVLLLLLLIFFCIIWGYSKIQENAKLEISYPTNKQKLLQHCDYVDMPTTHPENSTSGKNGTYKKGGTDKEREVNKELEDTKLLPSESYWDNASIRMRESSGPQRTDSCYMASSAKKKSLEVKPINREMIGFTPTPHTGHPAYMMVSFHGEDIPVEQLSSFRSHHPQP